MKRSGKIVVGIITGIVAAVAFVVFLFIRTVLGIFGYTNPVERYHYKLKTDAALEKKYPGHDFDVVTELYSGEYGFSLGIHATDENGIEFGVQWVDDEMEDHYHDEWNKLHYGKKLVEYQNGLRDELFPQIPYVDTYEYYPYDTYLFFRGPFKEVFFESMEDAIEGSRACSFDTNVTFKGIDLDTADDEELMKFADSIADSLLWLYDRTGYYDIRINSFYYRKYDGYDAGFKSKDELVDSIVKNVKLDRKIKENRKKKTETENEKKN